jgi:hypothetical protein
MWTLKHLDYVRQVLHQISKNTTKVPLRLTHSIQLQSECLVESDSFKVNQINKEFLKRM